MAHDRSAPDPPGSGGDRRHCTDRLGTWFSRQREFRADAGAARLTGTAPMVHALERLAQASGQVDPRHGLALDSLMIAGRPDFFGLLASHPPLEERISALEAAHLKASEARPPGGLFGSAARPEEAR